MSIALLGHTQIAGASGGGTSSAQDTTGANLLVHHVGQYEGGTVTPPTDSKFNTYTGLTAKSVTSQGKSRIYYCASPVVGTGHTFNNASTNLFGSSQIAWFGGVSSTPFDVENGAITSSGSTRSTGSLTPTEDNELVIAAVCQGTIGGTFSASIDSGFTITDQQVSNASTESAAMAYKIQTTAGAENPTWSLVSNGGIAATIAAFKAAAAGGGGGGSSFLSRYYYDMVGQNRLGS